MDFEDRLRDQLHHQTADIEIRPEGVDVLAGRVRTRRTRRVTAAAMAALIVVAGMTGYLIGREADEPAQVATQGGDDESSDETVGDTSSDRDAAAASSPSGSDPSELPDVALPDPGSPLVFTNVDDDSSPGGYSVYQNGWAGDIYYVLSTAPGSTWEELDARGRYGPDTLYTWDGDRWSTGSFGDRFVSEISGDGGVLYAISTGSVTSDGLAAGTSSDAGESWTWTPIDLSGQFPDGDTQYMALTASKDGVQLVVVHRSAGADWEEAIALARSAGVDIDQETDAIFEIDSDGIAWAPDSYVVSPCQAAYNDYFESRYAEDEEELYEPPFAYGDDLTDEQLDELRAWEEEQERVWEDRRLGAIDHVRTVPGCEEFVECTIESDARQKAISEKDQSMEMFEALERRAEAGEEITDEEWMAAEEASAALWDEYNDWLEQSGCRVVLYGDYDEPDPEDVQRRTWEELGVVAPAAWSGSTHAYLITDGDVRALGAQFAGSDGWLVDVRSSDAGFEVVFDDSSYDEFEALGAEPVEPDQFETVFTTWRSPNGTEWTSSSSSVGGYGSQSATVAGSTLSIAWTERGGSDLIRTNPDGTSDRLRLADLAGELDTTGYELVAVKSGPYGAVAWAANWSEFERGVPEDEYSPNAIVLYSPDGRGWGATSLPGADVTDVIVGRDGVMVFLADPDFNGPDTPPQPVLLGRAG